MVRHYNKYACIVFNQGCPKFWQIWLLFKSTAFDWASKWRGKSEHNRPRGRECTHDLYDQDDLLSSKWDKVWEWTPCGYSITKLEWIAVLKKTLEKGSDNVSDHIVEVRAIISHQSNIEIKKWLKHRIRC